MIRSTCYLLFLFWLLYPQFLHAQGQTNGDRSPIVVGNNSSLKYELTHSTEFDLPETYQDFLYGLLVLNNVEENRQEIKGVLSAWIVRYNQLKQKIDNLPPNNKREQAKSYLQQGKFSSIEKLLDDQESSSLVSELIRPTYQTTGTNSPIIIGDYTNVTYAVKTVIKYELPERLTKQVFDQLEQRDAQIQALQSGNRESNQRINRLKNLIEDKETSIRNWVLRYKKLEEQLKSMPTTISDTIRTHFLNSDYESALSAFDLLSSSETAIKESYLIKANIILLSLKEDYNNDKIEEVERLFQVAYSMQPDLASLLDYGDFLIEYSEQSPKIILELEKYPFPGTMSVQQQIRYTYILAKGYAEFNLLQAAKLLRQCFELAQEANDFRTVDIAFDLCALYLNMNAPERVSEVLPFKFIEEDQLSNIDQGRIHYYYGGSALLQGKLNQALRSTEQGLSICRKGTKNELANVLMLNELIFLKTEVIAQSGDILSAIDTAKYGFSQISPFVDGSSQRLFSDAFKWINRLIFLQMNLANDGNVAGTAQKGLQFISQLPVQDEIDLDGYRAELYLFLGRDLYRVQKYDKAYGYLMKALRYFRQHVREVPQIYMESYLDVLDLLYNSYLFQEETDKGIKLLEKQLPILKEAVTVAPEQFYTYEAQLYAMFVSAYINLEKPEAAVFYAKKILQLIEPYLPRSPEGNINLYMYSLQKIGKLYQQAGKYATCLQLYEQKLPRVASVIKQNPQFLDGVHAQFGNLLVRRANIYRLLHNRFTGGFVWYSNALTYFNLPDILTSNNAIARIHYGSALVQILDTLETLYDKANRRRDRKKVAATISDFLNRFQDLLKASNYSLFVEEQARIPYWKSISR